MNYAYIFENLVLSDKFIIVKGNRVSVLVIHYRNVRRSAVNRLAHSRTEKTFSVTVSPVVNIAIKNLFACVACVSLFGSEYFTPCKIGIVI